MKKILLFISVLALSSNFAIAQDEAIDQMVDDMMVEENQELGERAPRGERRDRIEEKMGEGDENRGPRGDRRKYRESRSENDGRYGQVMGRRVDSNQENGYGGKGYDNKKSQSFMKSLPENVRQRIAKRREVMKNLTDDQKKAVKAERERHREAIKNITGVDLFE